MRRLRAAFPCKYRMPTFTQPFNLTAGITPTFFDDFTSLSLYNWRNPTAGGTWMPSRWYNPAWDGEILPGNTGWDINPFNPATPDNTVFTLAQGSTNPFSAAFSSDFGDGTPAESLLLMTVKVTPSSYAAATGFAPYVTPFLTTQPSFRQRFGYFEARIALQTAQGFGAAFWLVTEDDSNEIDIAEMVSPSGHNNDAWLSHFGMIDFASRQPIFDWYTYQTFASYDPTQFHLYGFDWQPATCTVYFDRQAVETFATPEGYNATNGPSCFFVLELGTGQTGSWEGPLIDPTVLPRGMFVDYVAAYPAKPF